MWCVGLGLGAEHPVRNRAMFTPLNSWGKVQLRMGPSGSLLYLFFMSVCLMSFHSSAGLAQKNLNFFLLKLKRMWINLFSRNPGVKKTTSNLEHVFMGEIRKRTR